MHFFEEKRIFYFARIQEQTYEEENRHLLKHLAKEKKVVASSKKSFNK